jgi:hypothetical protein
MVAGMASEILRPHQVILKYETLPWLLAPTAA